MPAPPPGGCGRTGTDQRPRQPEPLCWKITVLSRPVKDGSRGTALGEKRVQSCRGWNEEAAEEKAVSSQGSRWGIATERRSGGIRRGSHSSLSRLELVPKPSGPSASGRKGSRSTGGCNTGATGADFIYSLGTFPLGSIPGVPSPWHGSPGMTDLARDGDEGHEPGSPQPLRYQIRPPPSLSHAVLARPK